MTDVWHILLSNRILTPYLTYKEIGRLASISLYHSSVRHAVQTIHLSGSQVQAKTIIKCLHSLVLGRYPNLQSLYVSAPTQYLFDKFFSTYDYQLQQSGNLLINAVRACQCLHFLIISNINLEPCAHEFFDSLPTSIHYLYLCNTNVEKTNYIIPYKEYLSFCRIISTIEDNQSRI